MVNFTYSYQATYPIEGYHSNLLLNLSQDSERFALTKTCSKQPSRTHEPSRVHSLSRDERNRIQSRRGLDRFRKRFFDHDLPGKEHALDYLQGKYRRNLRHYTVTHSCSSIFYFLKFIKKNGKKSLSEITRKDIEAFVEHEQDRDLMATSIKNTLGNVYTFMSYLVDKRIVQAEILLKKVRIKVPDTLPRAIDAGDIKRLLAVVDDIRTRAIILLLLRTGMRIGELLDLKSRDINLAERKVMIYIGEKNFRGRVVYFSDDAGAALQRWMEIRDPQKEYLFYGMRGNPLCYVQAKNMFYASLKKAGLDHKGYTLHRLRHTYATDLLNAGLRLEVLQNLLGHSDLEVTRRYARLSDKTREEEYFQAMAIIEKGEADGYI